MVKENMIRMIVEKLMSMSTENFCEMTGIYGENDEYDLYDSYETRIADAFRDYSVEDLFDLLISVKSGDVIEYNGKLTYVVYYYKDGGAADLIVRDEEGSFILRSYVNFSLKNITRFYGHSKIDSLDKLFEGVGADGSFGVF